MNLFISFTFTRAEKKNEVPKILILILSIMLVFTSSCTMKKTLWEYMGVEKVTNTKAALPSVSNADVVSFQSMTCSVRPNTELNPVTSEIEQVKAPTLLFAALLLLPWVLFQFLRDQKTSFVPFQFNALFFGPIYLKLGRLIYYS